MDIKEHIPLAKYTSFRVGGPARFFTEAADENELRQAVRFAQSANLPKYILGGGTNVLVSDEGFPGLVIRVAGNRVCVEGERIVADAGSTLGKTVVTAQRAGLTGFEWAVGLPGTVGGAVYGNSGCFGGEIKDIAESVTLLDPSDCRMRIISYGELEPRYRHTKLMETGEIVLAATFKLRKGDPEEIAAVVAGIREKSRERIAEQPLGAPTAGSTFKGAKLTLHQESRIKDQGLDYTRGINRAGLLSAGWLIEQAGLKGLRMGDAEISPKHANFIINHGDATARDIKALIDTVKDQVANAFGIRLEEEIRYVGF